MKENRKHNSPNMYRKMNPIELYDQKCEPKPAFNPRLDDSMLNRICLIVFFRFIN